MKDATKRIENAGAPADVALRTTDATTLTTGQYLTAVLLAVAPTALGGALGAMDPTNQNPSPADWTAALKTVGDSPAVNAALLPILTSALYKQIITALRTPVPLLNNDVQKTPVRYSDGTAVKLDVSFVRGLVLKNATNLTTPWSGGPPHPAGQDLLNLITLLSGYNEAPQPQA
jgi:hypothetical protein